MQNNVCIQEFRQSYALRRFLHTVLHATSRLVTTYGTLTHCKSLSFIEIWNFELSSIKFFGNSLNFPPIYMQKKQAQICTANTVF